MWISVGASVGAYQDGQIKILAVAAEERVEQLPDVPTYRELGEDFIDGADRGIAIRKGVDEEVYNYLVEEFKKVIETPEFKAAMEKIGGIGMYKTPEQYQSYMDNTYQSIVDILPKLEDAAAK